jgi:hypothetical protein
MGLRSILLKTNTFENQLDFNTRVRLVKYQDGILYHSAPIKISKEMIQDLKAHGVDVEYQLLDTLKSNNTHYFEMNQQDSWQSDKKLKGQYKKGQ